MAIADPVLLPPQPPSVAFTRRGGLNRSGVGARRTLGERKARRNALRQLAEIELLLLLASGQQHRKGPKLVDAEDRCRRRAARPDRLDHRYRGCQTRPRPAISLGDEQAGEL